MPEYVYSGGALPLTKSDLVSVPGGADVTKYLPASDVNAIMSAIADLKAALLAGKYHGVTVQTSTPATPPVNQVTLFVRSSDNALCALLSDGSVQPISTQVLGSYGIAVTANGSTTPRTLGARFSDVINVEDYGAVGNGTTDDTTAIQAAVTAGAGKTIWFPRPSVSYKIIDTINVSAANTRLFGDGSKIYMALSSSHATGKLFHVTASGVEFDNLWIDSTGTSATTTGNKYAIQAHGTSGTHITDFRVHDCQFTNLPWADGPSVLSSHAVYMQYIDRLTVEQNRFDAPSGSAIFMSVCTAARIVNNNINDTGWYSIQFNDGVEGALVMGNRITGTVSGGRNWGGSINLMSNSVTGGVLGTGNARIKYVNIIGNYISGVHSYTSAISIQSCSHISVTNNILRDISLTDTTPPTYIRAIVRPVLPGTANEGINDHIDISDNLLIAKGVDDIAIYADAQDNGSGTLAYSDTLIVARNRIVSLDTSNYFAKAVIVHGQNGGWKNISIINNQISGFPSSASPVSGLMGTIGLVAAPLLDVQIIGNNLMVVGGTSANSTHLGLAVDAYTTRATVFGNTFTSFWNGIRTFTNAATLYIWGNAFNASGNADYTFGVASSPIVFPVAPSFTNFAAALAVIQTSQAGVAEVLAQFSVSDVTVATGSYQIKNGSTTDADYYTFLDAVSKGTNVGVLARASITTDTGTNAAFDHNARTTVPAALATRPLAAWQNNGTRVIYFDYDGGIKGQRFIAPVSADRGDANQTLTVGTDAQVQRWATTLTANRTITLATTHAVSGDQFRVVRTGLGAFTLDVGGLKTIPSATAAFVDVAYSGSAWVLVGYGTL